MSQLHVPSIIKFKFTPGPWIARKGAGWFVYRPDAERRRDAAIALASTPAITMVEAPTWFDDAEVEANARLIAEAPQLLLALDALITIADMGLPLAAATIEQCRSIIAKAAGAV